MKSTRDAYIKQIKEKNPFLSNTEVVYQAIREDIVTHRIKPGDRLNQEQLAEELCVSRTPVRDALYLLERDGYLSKNTQGYSVYEMTITDYMLLVDLRTAIECLAVKLACSKIRVSESNKIQQNIEAARTLLNEGFSLAWDDDLNIINQDQASRLIYKFGELDQEFHSLIVAASHNEYVIEAYDQLKPKIHFYRYNVLDINSVMNMTERHRIIYECIVNREEELAEKKMMMHLHLTINSAK